MTWTTFWILMARRRQQQPHDKEEHRHAVLARPQAAEADPGEIEPHQHLDGPEGNEKPGPEGLVGNVDGRGHVSTRPRQGLPSQVLPEAPSGR